MGKVKTLLFGLLLFLAAPAAGQYTAPPTDATSHTICDDCYANVPLGHAFPFYGETFTNSWMMANGVVMFRNPTDFSFQSWPDKGWCCNGLEVANIAANKQDKFSFAIAPFWTDLIQKDNDGGFYSKTSADGTKYWWVRIEEYNKNHENTFSLEILPTGDYAMEYGDLKVNNHSIFIGAMGDISEDEYIQHEFYGVSNQTNYIYGTAAGNAGTKAYQSEGLACAYDPLSSQQCDGYAAAYLAQQCGIDPLYDQQCTGYADAFFDQQCDNDSFYSTSCDGYDDAFEDLQCDLDPLYTEGCDGYYEALIEEQLANMEEEEEWLTDEEEETMYGIVGFAEDDGGIGGISDEDEFFTGLPDEFFTNESPIDLFATLDIEPILIEEEGFFTMPLNELPETIEEEFRADALEAIEENIEEVEEYLDELFETETLEEFEEIFEEEILEELSELEAIEEIAEEEFIEEEELTEIIEEETVEETAETVSEPKTSPIATRIAMAQTKNALKVSASAVSMSQESSKSEESGQSQQNGQNQSGGSNLASDSGSGTISETIESAQIDHQSASSSSQNSVSMMNQQFFGNDTQIFSDMSGISVETLETNAEINSISIEIQSEQMQTEIENNLISTGTPVSGVTIIPVEVISVQPMQEAPRKSLAEVISEQVAKQKMENSNKVASGQTKAIASLQSSVDLGSYYESKLTDGDFYNVNYIVYDNKIDDNARLLYNLSKSNHGTIRKMIRSQYE
tara:strand:+ start:7707 stop:9917 length:2211 start_codon:yes stop_codon:yes gene_type:complete